MSLKAILLHMNQKVKTARLLTLTAVFLSSFLPSLAQQWPEVLPEARPATRWWWLGSAVDSANLKWNLEQYARAGLGGVEITPIYGVQANEQNEIPYLSSRWMQMLRLVETEGKRLGIETDMSTGTGWPFGGPDVPLSQAACKAIFQDYELSPANGGKSFDISCTDAHQKLAPQLSRVMLYVSGQAQDLTSKAVFTPGKSFCTVRLPRLPKGGRLIVLYVGRTQQMVKRAAPGGEGYVIDHFDSDAVRSYLSRFTTAFATHRVQVPHTFFNDSYEVYGADWTPRLLEQFNATYGYRLENYFPQFLQLDSLRSETDKRILSDYRELMGRLLYSNFTCQWTDWAHELGAITRNQAHGSPANLIDLYAAVDIPECEGFGLTDFGLRGLRRDEGHTRKNYSDISMLKYASSGAHISGHRFTSSETFTWLTEHFRTSFSQCKPDLDLMFLSGVNHVFFHGTCYSPSDAPWPGWRFYASVDMSPTNPQWNAMPTFSDYITRCQSFLQWGEPDNDCLVYLPYYDMIYNQPGQLPLFDIHSMDKRAPRFIRAIQTIISQGYDVDYISDRYLLQTQSKDGLLTTNGKNFYSSILIPEVRFMETQTLCHLRDLARAGATVIFVGHLPESEPGFQRLQQHRPEVFRLALDELRPLVHVVNDYAEAVSICRGKKEPMRTRQHLSCIRRSNAEGYHYFISNLTPNDVCEAVELGVNFSAALLYNPMTGQVTRPTCHGNRIELSLASGESVLLRTYNEPQAFQDIPKAVPLVFVPSDSIQLTAWTLDFPESHPVAIHRTFPMEKLQSWTQLGDTLLEQTMATGRYTTTFSLPKHVKQSVSTHHGHVILDLGDVRESARVVLNGQEVQTLFAVPFRCDITSYLKQGKNKLEVYVTNLPANRIAQMDREGKAWRRFKEINVVNLDYKRTHYDSWSPVPSGLCSDVWLKLQIL